jgi:hypothetical protein
MFMRSLVAALWLQTAQSSNDSDILTKLFVLVVAALHAILQSTFFWFCVAAAFVSWWVSSTVRDAVRDGVKEAIQGLDLEGTVRDAVRDALEEDQEDRRDGES